MKICIIGGRGQMGRLFEKIFLSKGHDIVVQGRKTYDNLAQDVNSSDITIISVPLDVASKVVEDVACIIDKDKLVVDFSSVMGSNLTAMKKLKCSSAFIHPLFGPDIDSLKNLNFIVVPIKKAKKLDWFIEFLKEEDANVNISTVEKHDEVMAVVQGLTHFNNITFGKTLAEHGIDDRNYATTLFSMNKRLINRLFTQEPHVTENIQFMNDKVTGVLEKHKKNFDEIYNIVKAKDKNKLEKEFKTIAKELNVKGENRKIKVKKPVRKWDKNAVAVLGPRGSFTDGACSSNKKIYVDTITEVLQAVKDGNVKEGIVPLENSIQGTVTESLDGINYCGLHITKAIVMPIHHCCASLGKEIDLILSHPQALVQCSRFISRNYPKAKLVHTLSTTEAFQIIQEDQLHNAVAIGPLIAASIYGLKVLSEDIEDEKNNKTKFVVVSSEAAKGGKMTSIVILPFHEKQGILFNLLKFFNEGKINLTKIESRPVKDELGKYLFYIDFDGDVSDSVVQKCLANIMQHVGSVKVLGCYDMVECD